MTQDNTQPAQQPSLSDAKQQNAKAVKDTHISGFAAKLVASLNRMATDEDFRKAVEKKIF